MSVLKKNIDVKMGNVYLMYTFETVIMIVQMERMKETYSMMFFVQKIHLFVVKSTYVQDGISSRVVTDSAGVYPNYTWISVRTSTIRK